MTYELRLVAKEQQVHENIYFCRYADDTQLYVYILSSDADLLTKQFAGNESAFLNFWF